MRLNIYRKGISPRVRVGTTVNPRPGVYLGVAVGPGLTRQRKCRFLSILGLISRPGS